MKTERIRMFKNPFLEKFSSIHPIGPLLFWGPIVLWLLYRSFSQEHIQLGTYGTLTFCALLAWSFVEYILHRFVFHFTPRGPISKTIVYMTHGIHHDDPADKYRAVMPIAPAVFFVSMFWYLFKFILGDVYIYYFFAVFLIGYLCYDYIHYAVHHHVPTTALGKFLRKNHLLHHARYDERYGVSSPLWDYILSTVENPQRSFVHKGHKGDKR